MFRNAKWLFLGLGRISPNINSSKIEAKIEMGFRTRQTWVEPCSTHTSSLLGLSFYVHKTGLISVRRVRGQGLVWRVVGWGASLKCDSRQSVHSTTGDSYHRRMLTSWLAFSFYILVSLLDVLFLELKKKRERKPHETKERWRVIGDKWYTGSKGQRDRCSLETRSGPGV